MDALASPDIVASLEKPSKTHSVTGKSLIEVAAINGILQERILNKMLAEIYNRKDRLHLYKVVVNDDLGFKILRSYWYDAARFRDNDATLNLDHLIKVYNASEQKSIARIKFRSLILGQSYRERMEVRSQFVREPYRFGVN